MPRRDAKNFRHPAVAAGKRPLSDRERRFCALYAVSLNAQQAATEAGFPERSARQRGYELLQREDVQAEVARIGKQAADTAEVTAGMVLNELRRVAFSDIGRAMEWDDTGTKFIASKELDPDTRAAVAEVAFKRREMTGEEEGEVVEKRLKMHDKMAALGILARATGAIGGDAGAVSPEAAAQRIRDQLAAMDATVAPAA